MKDVVLKYGFAFSRRGCSCAGSPYIFRREGYEITIYEHRKLWRMTKHNTTIAKGTDKDLELKLKEIWD